MSSDKTFSTTIETYNQIKAEFTQKLPNWQKFEHDLQLIELVVRDSDDPISLNHDCSSIAVPKALFKEYHYEIQLLIGWFSLLKLFVRTDIAIDIAFALVNFDLSDLKRNKWVDQWRQSLITHTHLQVKSNIYNIIPWLEKLNYQKEKEGEELTEASSIIIDLLKMKIDANYNLDHGIITKTLHKFLLKQLPPLKLNLLETLKAVIQHQTDDLNDLIKDGTTEKSYSTLNRHIKRLIDEAYILKRYIPQFDHLGFTNVHILTENKFLSAKHRIPHYDHMQDTKQGIDTKNPWQFSHFTGYGNGKMDYYQFVTPSSAQATWQTIANEYQNSQNNLLLRRYKEPEFLFSTYFWQKNKQNWVINEEILDSLAKSINTGEISDSFLDFSGRLVSNSRLQLGMHEFQVLNAVIKSRSFEFFDIGQIVQLKETKTRNILKYLKSKHLIRKAFYPVFSLFPDRIILFVKTNLFPYDNFHDMLKFLPYTKIETAREIKSHNIWRIVTILSPYGSTDTVLKVILDNFVFEDLKVFKPFNLIGSNWLFPVHLYHEESHTWNFDWREFNEKIMDLLV